MPQAILRAGVSSSSPGSVLPTATGGSGVSVTFDGARQNLFRRCGSEEPAWKDVIYHARHRTSIVGAQVQMLADVRGMIPRYAEFEVRPDKWVRCGDHETDDRDVKLAIDIAVKTLAEFRSNSGNRAQPFRSIAEIYGSTGEGYGIEHTGRQNKPAVSIVHCPAVEVLADQSCRWRRRRNGDAADVPAGQYRRLFVDDETFVDDATSSFRHLALDIATHEIINAALRAGGTADLVSRGLMWAPAQDPKAADHWVNGYMHVVQALRDDPTILAGMVPYPVTTADGKPEHIDFGTTIQDNLIKLHELSVDVIARGSPLPAKLVKDGPGEAAAWGDHMLQRVFLQFSALPMMQDRVYPDVASWWWHPRLDRNPQFASTGIESCRFRIIGDIGPIANRPDSRAELLNGWKMGLFRKKFVGEPFGATDDDFLVYGSPEWEQWRDSMLAIAANAANGVRDQLTEPGVADTAPSGDGIGGGTQTGPRRFAEVGALW